MTVASDDQIISLIKSFKFRFGFPSIQGKFRNSGTGRDSILEK
jgi:hypothetical protein